MTRYNNLFSQGIFFPLPLTILFLYLLQRPFRGFHFQTLASQWAYKKGGVQGFPEKKSIRKTIYLETESASIHLSSHIEALVRVKKMGVDRGDSY
jgi:hypothetical protein